MRGLILAISVTLALAACMARPWTEHSYPAWGFAVSFPAAPVAQDTSTPVGERTVRGFAVTGSGDDKQLAVGVIDLTGVGKPDDQVMSEAVQAIANGKPVNVAYWALGPAGNQHMGRAAVIDLGNGLKMVLHVLIANGKLYQISATSLGGSSPKTEKFLDSFRILDPVPAP